MVEAFNSTNDLEEREYSDAELKELTKLYESTMGSINEGEIIKGRVVHIAESSVIVDIGFKSEGAIPITEFPNIKDIKVGEEVEVFLEAVENKDGQLILSRKRADFMRV
ncbi:MAG: S1 RNA-binding domain-containing protein, partial [Ignavibacteriales bacterium]|nr:S1 RNA-binding domain-containing protein [Ignavibacteriales bacterium]